MRKQKLFHDLDEARMARSVWVENHFDYAGSARKYALAFADFGLNVTGAGTEALARRIAAEEQEVREALFVALADWTFSAGYARDAQLVKDLRALAQRADTDPWRKRYRAAVAGNDRVSLRDLSVEARRLSLPPSSLTLLAFSLQLHGEREEALALLRWARAGHPTDFWLHFQLGSLLGRGKDTTPLENEEAIGSYRAARALRPAAAGVYNNFGLLLLHKKQFDEAIVEFCKAIKLDPKNAGFHVNRGDALAGQGKREEAIADYREAAVLRPEGDFPHYRLGAALRDKGDVDGALTEFRRACMLNPNGWGARRELLRILGRRGQLNEIRELRIAWKKAMEHHLPDHEACAGYAQLCLFFGEEEEYRRHRGWLLARFGGTTDPVIAERVSRACLLLPASGDELQRAAALADRAVAAGLKHEFFRFFLAAKGLVEYRRERFDRAIDLLQQAEAKGNAMPVTRLVLAMARHRFGQTQQAQQTLATALQSYDWSETMAYDQDRWTAHVLRREAEILIVPNDEIGKAKNALPHYNRGNDLKAKNQLDDAITEYSKAIGVNPTFAKAWTERGALFVRQARWKEAAADFVKLTELDPDSALWLDAASLLIRAGDRDGYQRLSRKMAERFANDERPLHIERLTKVSLLMPNGAEVAPRTLERLTRTLDDGRTASDFVPWVRATLALAAYRKGNLQEALRYVPQSTGEQGVPPNRAICLVLLGMIRHGLGQPERAQRSFAQAAELIGTSLRKLAQGEVPAWPFRDWLSAEILWREAAALNGDAAKLLKKADDEILKVRNAMTHYNLGTTHKAKEHLDDAIAEFGKAIELDPTFANAWTERGRLFVRQARWKEAATDFVKLTKLIPQDTSRWVDAAALLTLAGDRDGYRRLCRRMTDRFAKDEHPVENQRVMSASLLLSNLGVRTALRQWQASNDLAGISDTDAMAKLPANQRQVCQQLWQDVAALMTKAGERLILVAGGPKDVEGIAAVEAQTPGPTAVTFDEAGNLYFTDWTGHRVRKIDTKGRITTIAGTGAMGASGDGGPAIKAMFNAPQSLLVAPNGDLLVADSRNYRVRKIDAKTGIITTIVGTGDAGFSGDGGPATQATFGEISCLALDAKGEKLYLADFGNRRIRMIDLGSGIVSTVAGNGKTGVPKDGADAKAAPLANPRGIALDRSGQLYIGELGGKALRVVDVAGRIRTVAGNGAAGQTGDGGPARDATLLRPVNLCLDCDGNVLIADANKIRRYLPKKGMIELVAGTGEKGTAGTNGPPELAELSLPRGIAVDPMGAIYIADTNNHRIVKIEK